MFFVKKIFDDDKQNLIYMIFVPNQNFTIKNVKVVKN